MKERWFDPFNPEVIAELEDDGIYYIKDASTGYLICIQTKEEFEKNKEYWSKFDNLE